MPYLLLALSPPPRRSLLQPSSFFDLGHVDILYWDPPGAPRSFGFYVSPSTRWRVFLSVFWSQAGRIVASERFTPLQTYWRAWEISPEQLASVKRYLDDIVEGCATGRTRYRALRFNCFHLARQCLLVAGQKPGRLPAHWVLMLPTLGASSFRRGPMTNAAHSSMEAELLRDGRKAAQWIG